VNKTQKVIVGVAAATVLVGFGPWRWPTIQNHQRGVIRTFGVVEDKLFDPGLHYLAPWSKLERVSVEYLDMNFMSENDNGEIYCLTKDGYTISVPISVNWAVNPKYLALVKSRLPGYYTDRQVVIIRSAVRDAIAPLSFKDGTLYDREAVSNAIAMQVRAKTTAYYRAQGYTQEQAEEIVLYGLLTLRGLFPPEEVMNANKDVAVAKPTADALAIRTKVPDGRTASEYTKVMQAQAVAKAVQDGNASINVITGDNPAAAIITGKK
jgi:regulator of protease activity HflC (stomatin/prohibitin superfamily)